MRKLASVLGVVVVAFGLFGCTSKPVVVTDALPDYVIVQQSVGADESQETRLAVDAKAAEACRSRDRKAVLPAANVECMMRHWYFGTCIIYRYHFACR